ncbi:exonuclease [Paracoccus pacificus]|uniref:Exonuclease n=1 Tax=Paracoccus pacificus TaxID=1463598 RepID=A0ABW4RBD8_9RHOB
MTFTLIFDCEFLTAEGAQSRFWCGPHDPDPVVAQIGAVKMGLTGDFPILDTHRSFVIPRARDGARRALDPFFTRLTGVSEEDIDRDGVPLADALENLRSFAAEEKLWSWGKDEFNLIAISCFVEGLSPPIPATRFGNACTLLLKAGMPYEDMKKTPSNRLAEYYRLNHPPLRGDDALDDALSVSYVIQHLLRQGALTRRDFA